MIVNGEIWIDMINDRNLTSHTYNEETAKLIYERIKNKYIKLFLELEIKLAGELKL
ncbi:nucleotidyltransferase substrate binding protein [Vulcanibacillus modesticaldus]|uniref:nucleotidyltransferase substrate binding protein n=1 Tax=Vulcanibacillus modesticaldus TaxID=337097 RepID=UPI0024813C36|nr:nucleotidyltransferase substrate binding protein [Vulcanibacillus modesticaldus]